VCFLGKAELIGQHKKGFKRRSTNIDNLGGAILNHQAVEQGHLSFEVVDRRAGDVFG
jgi:hypothetical protein